MTIQLGSTKSVVIAEAVTKSVSEVTLRNIFDIPSEKIVVASLIIAGFQKELKLWSGADYDAAGDWTQAQAETKIKSLL